MRHRWITLDTVETPEGPLRLQQRGERSFVIAIAGRVLMSSVHTRSEIAVAELGCQPVRDRPAPRVLVGGLGLGYTLRAALDFLPATAKVTVAELNPVVVDWCRGPVASLSGDALADPRVTVLVGDVTTEIARIAGDSKAPRLDAVILDLYEGPPEPSIRGECPLYGRRILEATHAALSPEGVLATWGEVPSPSYEKRMRSAGFKTQLIPYRGGGPRHAVHLGTKSAPPRRGRKGR
jgi:spermidine synthase